MLPDLPKDAAWEGQLQGMERGDGMGQVAFVAKVFGVVI